MYPAQSDLQLYRGDYFEMLLRLREGNWVDGAYEPGDYMNLQGWSGKAEVRATTDAASALATFTVVVLPQSGDTLGGVHLYLGTADTASMQVSSAVWDFQLTEPGAPARVHTYLRGKVTITKDVTR